MSSPSASTVGGRRWPPSRRSSASPRASTAQQPTTCCTVRSQPDRQNLGYRRRDRNSEVTVTNSGREGSVTRASSREYAAVRRLRYQQATRAEKHQLLDEIVAVTGLHRKAAIRLLRRAPRAWPPQGPATGRAEVLWPG